MVKAIPFTIQTLLLALSPQVGIQVASLHHYLKLGILGKKWSVVKPMLTVANKVARVDYCKRCVGTHGCFDKMLDHLGIDEKWGFLTGKECSYIFVPVEELPPNRFGKNLTSSK